MQLMNADGGARRPDGPLAPPQRAGCEAGSWQPASPERGGQAKTGTGRLPHRIGLVDAGRGGAASILLDDFAEALIAYDRAEGRPEAEGGRLARLDGDGGRAERVEAVVIEVPLDMGPAHALPRGVLRRAPAGCRVYALAACGPDGAPEAETALEPLRSACPERGLTWCGALIAEDAELVAAARGTARMGWWRRWCSEAVDRLVGAVRFGMSVAEADEVLGPGRRGRRREGDMPTEVILARTGLPRPLARLATRLLQLRGGRSG